MVTYKSWLKIAEAEGVSEYKCFKHLIDTYADCHDYMENRKVFVYIENDQWV